MLDIDSVMIVLYWRLTRKDVRYRLCNDSFILEIDKKRWLDIASVMIVLYWKLTRKDVRYRLMLDIDSVMIVLYWRLTRKDVRYRLCNDSFILEIDQKRC